MKLHHVGYATSSIQQSLKLFQQIGYQLSGELIFDHRREIQIQFIEDIDGQRIELIEDLVESNSRYAGKVLAARSGAYHLAYETQRINALAKRLGLRIIGKCEPAVAFGGNHVAFFVGKDGAIFEFISTEQKCDHS